VAADDLLESDSAGATGKGRIHYLLRHRSVLDIDVSVLQSVARVDGGIVMDRSGRLLAFGAILRSATGTFAAQDGGRTTAAVNSSRFGPVLKISEDGVVAFFRAGERVWEF
jgi:hypothetical protein